MTGTRTSCSNWFLPLTSPSTSGNIPALLTETQESSDKQSVSEYLYMATPGQVHQDDKCSDPETVHFTKLCWEGGVVLLNALMVFAVPSTKHLLPEESNIREWTFKDIQKLSSNDQKQ
jgi:hypothetical protein